MVERTNRIEKLLGFYFCEQHSIDTNKEYEIEMVEGKTLLSADRIDLVAKLEWIKAHKNGKGIQYAEKLYREQVKAITGRTGKEGGNETKTTVDSFCLEFEKLLSVEENGFDSNISVVPVDRNGRIMDGAHRTALSIYFNLKLPIVRLPIDYPKTDVKFFQDNLLDQELIEDLVYKYCKITNKNVYAICLWPRGEDSEKRRLAERLIQNNTNVIYKKEIIFSFKALRNFIIQIYCNFDWLGGVKDNFAGASVKANNCWSERNSTLFYFVEGKDLHSILELKNNIRDIFKVENHSVHITDTNSETCQVAELVLNSNSLDLLINGSPDRYQKINFLIEDFKKTVVDNNFDMEDFVIDSSAVLALYGLREANDIDYLSKSLLHSENVNIDSHYDYLKYHSHPLDELLYNPKYHLYYNRVKFISLETAKEFKENRGETKDLLDVQLIDSLRLNKKTIRMQLAKMKYDVSRYFRFYYREFKIKVKNIKWIAPFYKFLKKLIKGDK